MTYKNERWSISKSLHLLLDLYERDPSVPHTLLSNDLNPFGAFDDDLGRVALTEQLELLKHASKSTREEILKKTLIDARGSSIRQAVVEDYLSRPEKGLLLYEDPESTKSWSGVLDDFEAELATEQGMTYAEYKASGVREKLSEKKIEAELLRFFADRIEQIADVIERLDDTDFSKLVPERLVSSFRECHINFALGNYCAVCILAGSILERALKDLLYISNDLKALIKTAHEKDLLDDFHEQVATRVRRERNDAVHGDFGFITVERAAHSLLDVRSLVRKLYRKR
jgi:hypothetical protein